MWVLAHTTSALEKGTVRVTCLDLEHYVTTSTTGPIDFDATFIFTCRNQKAFERGGSI